MVDETVASEDAAPPIAEEPRPARPLAGNARYYQKLSKGVKMVSRTTEWDLENDARKELRNEAFFRCRVEECGLEIASTELLRERVSMREHTLVKDAIEAFWQAMRKTDGATTMIDGDGIADDSAADDVLAVSAHGYETLFLRTYRLLMEEFDPEAAVDNIKEDWVDDAYGEDGLKYRAFRECMGELVDVYAGTGKGVYGEFSAASYASHGAAPHSANASSQRALGTFSAGHRDIAAPCVRVAHLHRYARWLWELHRLTIDDEGGWRAVESLEFNPPLAGVDKPVVPDPKASRGRKKRLDVAQQRRAAAVTTSASRARSARIPACVQSVLRAPHPSQRCVLRACVRVRLCR